VGSVDVPPAACRPIDEFIMEVSNAIRVGVNCINRMLEINLDITA
jgi:hypothetical protein